ncbi:MAG: hypothetical protein WAL03_09315, partial [Pseudolabrys sp.]
FSFQDARKAESLTRQELRTTYPVLPMLGIAADLNPRPFFGCPLRATSELMPRGKKDRVIISQPALD